MSYKLLITSLLLSVASVAQACEICGCTISGQQFGILPQFTTHFVGLRYGHRSFYADHSLSEGREAPNEYFTTVELLGRYSITPRLQVIASLPYRHSIKHESYGSISSSGVGDASLTALYSVIDQGELFDGRWSQNLQIGGGVKLPTGKHNYEDSFGQWFPGLQNGSGSTDLQIMANYILRHKKVGALLEVSGRLNGKNSAQDFRFGHRFTSSLRGFGVISWGASTIMPSAGIMWDAAQQDLYQGEALHASGGNTVFGHIGVDILTSRIAVGATYNPTIVDDFAGGAIQSRNRFSCQILFFI